jgi:hypothetical protein
MYYKNGSERGDFKDVNVSSEKLKSRPERRRRRSKS